MRLLRSATIAFCTFANSSGARSEEHTSELQSHHDLVCRLLLERKKFLETAEKVVMKAGISQALVTWVGPRPVMAVGLALITGGMLFFLMIPRPPRSTLLPYTTLFR